MVSLCGFSQSHGRISASKRCAVKEAFIAACHLHYQRNKHHWEHWVVDGVAQEMPELYRSEMLADWWAMARALGNESPLAWYTMMKTEGRIVLHPETEAWVDKELGYENNHHSL
jgi:hypothetical protein